MSLSKSTRSVGTARTVAAVVNAATALRLSPPLKRVAHIVYFGSSNRKRSTLLSVQRVETQQKEAKLNFFFLFNSKTPKICFFVMSKLKFLPLRKDSIKQVSTLPLFKVERIIFIFLWHPGRAAKTCSFEYDDGDVDADDEGVATMTKTSVIDYDYDDNDDVYTHQHDVVT
jgi:hypothetical protein